MKCTLFPALVLSLFAWSAAQALPEAEIQRYIDEAIKAGGGEVVIPPGVHLIEKGLLIKDAKKLRIIGLDAEECVLKLPPAAYGRTASPVEVGASRLPVSIQQRFKPGMRLRIEADGALDGFTGRPRPYQIAVVKAVADTSLDLEQPLAFPVPGGTLLRHEDAPNLLEVRGASEDVRIEKLTLDGGRVESDPPIRGHVQLCGLLAAGPYTYEKGPTGPQVKKLHIARCFIQNCHGRGIALYSVEAAEINDCTIRDTSDEAIDFDHFSVKCIATHNNIARCLIGVELNDASSCLVAGNEFRDCGTGINLWRWCKQPGLNEGNIIAQNFLENTRGNAIQIAKGTRGNSVLQNEISGSGKNGIILSGEAQVVKANKITASKLKDLTVQEGTHDLEEGTP